MTSSESQIDKPQRGRPKRAELPDVNINTGTQSINTESFFKVILKGRHSGLRNFSENRHKRWSQRKEMKNIYKNIARNGKKIFQLFFGVAVVVQGC